MPIPDFQTTMLPLVRLTEDGAEHTLVASVAALADKFHLSDDERAQRQPGSSQKTIYNRVAWAATYLRGAGLLASTGRGRFKITDRGRAILAAPPDRIDIKFLTQYPEFKAFREGTTKDSATAVPVVDTPGAGA